MRYAAFCKADSEPLDQFMRREGGISACTARFSRRLSKANVHPAGSEVPGSRRYLRRPPLQELDHPLLRFLRRSLLLHVDGQDRVRRKL
jgi:hypothetical protein